MANDENASESESESINMEKTGKKRKSKKPTGKLNHYSKKVILEYLKSDNKNNFDKIIKNFRCSRADVEDFINNHAKVSQLKVHLECDSPSFRSVNNWLEIFKEKGFNITTENETALTMKTIAFLEDHPDPNDCGGINFKHLYQFFGNIMNGEPTNELNEPTRTFLCDIFGELINDVNSETGDKNLEKLQKILLNNATNTNHNNNENGKSRTFKEDTFELGIDPLNISTISENNLL